MMNKTALILGGRSDIGMALAHRFARAGFDIILAARGRESLTAESSDITIRYGVTTYALEFDAAKPETHESFYGSLKAKPTVVIYSVGLLGDQSIAEADWREASAIIAANYTGAVSILSIVANDFAARNEGCIIGISSVAGDRGRRSNYIYGSAKSGLTAFLSGLRHRLTKTEVNVLTVKPGFVSTRMTAALTLPKSLTASPKNLADAVFRAYEKGRHTIYFLPVWRPIMFIVRNLPERLFLRSKL
jgi:decaprenylphospho-beta-D-erythro-pentofuranosid-2-ulose 2-reductase